jgi:hypothetical protein
MEIPSYGYFHLNVDSYPHPIQAGRGQECQRKTRYKLCEKNRPEGHWEEMKQGKNMLMYIYHATFGVLFYRASAEFPSGFFFFHKLSLPNMVTHNVVFSRDTASVS